MLWSEIQRLGNTLQDNRTIQERAAQMRNLVPIAGPSEDENLALYRKAVRDEKLSKMTPAERRLAEYEESIENRDAPPVEKPQAKASPKQDKVLALLEKIVSDPTRPRSDYEAAYQVYEQYGAGMDWKVADEWYDALAANQQKYLLGKQGDLVRQRQALQQQAEQLTAQMGEFVPSASLVEQRIKLLHGYANNSGKPLPDGLTHGDVTAARAALEAGDSAAAVDVISRASEVIDQWQASIGEAGQ